MSIVLPVLFFSYLENSDFIAQCIEGRNTDGTCAEQPSLLINTDPNKYPNKYTTVFDAGSPLEEIGTGNAVLTEDNCHRYAYWLTKYQKEKLESLKKYLKAS